MQHLHSVRGQFVELPMRPCWPHTLGWFFLTAGLCCRASTQRQVAVAVNFRRVASAQFASPGSLGFTNVYQYALEMAGSP